MISNRSSILVMATAVIISTEVMAADDTQVTQNEVTALIQKATDGYRVGSFLVKPEASVSGVYDSNVFATRKNEVEDEIVLISPSLHVGSMWDKHKLDLNMGGDFGRYQSYNSENYDVYEFTTYMSDYEDKEIQIDDGVYSF